MPDKTGKSYEHLTQAIFQSILRQKDFPNLKVEHDVTLEGKTAFHQIDVYWKFEMGGVPYETIVQTKDWSKPVEQGQLLLFKAILDDLPGQPRGIFVTRTGYQEGAKDFALAHGILLYELREATEPPVVMTVGGWAKTRLVRMPLDGVVTGGVEDASSVIALGFDVDVYTPRCTEINFEIPDGWLETEYPTIDAVKFRDVKFLPLHPHEILLYDERGMVAGSLGPVYAELLEAAKNEGVEQKRVTHIFERPTFVQTDSALIPRVKADSVCLGVTIEHKHETRRGKMPNLTQLVFRELNSDKTRWYGATPSVPL